ncbi:kazrin-like [Limulus polyphemus]|uniref:Kazrin-like n=1 Tax=Limulus polyphemus TaxID=6850 RepID=A0ABM1S7U0_LIMPO|nr:kazrin-like [Limulus polyphemus]XP_022239693.1 kazrin-like [Limulus polyphemus]XP_022239694.1 kazrin-like [Limulus polyphemus]XP_022239695.1 kazrin-like [Limulus polyphemus]XP_022239696.1 kazrin-like [Limulus polyphemus]
MAGNALTTCVPAETSNRPKSQGTECNSNLKYTANFSSYWNSNYSSNCPDQSVLNDVKNICDKQTMSRHKNVAEKKKTDTEDIKTTYSSCERCKVCTHEESNNLEERLAQLQEKNEKLSQSNKTLYREIEELQCYKEKANSEGNKDVSCNVKRLEKELEHAKEALTALKHDRKRLKGEKFQVLNHMKQLYSTLEDKEKELRDFIRNYEQRMKQSDEKLKQLVREREECEREKWNILKHAKDETEKTVTLCAQLDMKESQLTHLTEELNIVREKIGYSSDAESTYAINFRTNDHLSPTSTTSTVIPTATEQDTSSAPTPTAASDPSAETSTGLSTPQEDKSILPTVSRSAEEICSDYVSNDERGKKSRKQREVKGNWASISKVFTRGRQRKPLEPGLFEVEATRQVSSWSPQSSVCASPTTLDVYTEKVKLLEEAQDIPMEKWKAATVQAWVELSLGMPQYGAMCAENVKSGKILLELTNAELESGLGISNRMHRRKLRLAIEEHRDPSLCSFPKIYLLTHVWVIEDWLPSLGLTMYSENFAKQLVDGRILNTLSKKDLEKYLGISRKFHQVSIMHAIHLLRMFRFDLQLLIQRRSQCEQMDVDPVVWTNQRFIKWMKSIDLAEYAENLVDSGVHGALVVFEPSFTAGTMATALGIPASKNIIRRHLTTELENIIRTARLSLEAEEFVITRRGNKKNSSSRDASVGRNFNSAQALEKVNTEQFNTKLSIT